MREDVLLTVNGEPHLMYKEFDLGLTGFNIAPPEPKTNFVDIPFSNVSYDLTEYFGSVTYNRRPITLSFGFVKPLPCWQAIIDDVVNLFHGQEIQFSLASASEWTYTGRCTVTPSDKTEYNNAQVTISINALPMKTNNEGVERL